MSANHSKVTPLASLAHDADEATRWRLIRVRDLVLPASIGIYDREKRAPQRVCINVELRVRESDGPIGDDIANVLSYEDVIDGIKRIIAAGHINLVETLAERIAALSLSDPRVRSVRVRVEKLDVFPDAASVGIEIERHSAFG